MVHLEETVLCISDPNGINSRLFFCIEGKLTHEDSHI